MIELTHGPDSSARSSPAHTKAGHTGAASAGPASTAPAHDAATPAPDDAAARARFDIVRITPEGQALIAGRAPPGATVAVTAQGKLIGTTRADESGSWLLMPRQRIPQGPLALAVRMVGKSGH